MNGVTRVLVVDDSAYARKTIRQILDYRTKRTTRTTLPGEQHICGPANSSFGLISAISSHLHMARQIGSRQNAASYRRVTVEMPLVLRILVIPETAPAGKQAMAFGETI